MTKKTFKDSDILKAMEAYLDEDSIVYGADGQHAIGSFYDVTKVDSVLGGKDYNNKENVESATNAEAAKLYRKGINENLQNASWLKEY